MNPIPSLHALRAFEAAARLGSFMKAAEELHLTPSAISHQIRALEEHFDKPLFIRANRQVILTPEGERLLAALSEAFGIIREACTEILPDTGTVELSVHATPSFAAKWLSPRLPDFMAREPTIRIRISSSAETPDLLRQSGVDVVITYATAPTNPGLTTRSLGAEKIVALCAPEYEKASRQKGDDGQARMVCLESSISPVKWEDWFALNGLALPAQYPGPSFDRGSMAIAAATQGMGVALETTRFAQAEIEAGSLVPFGGHRFQLIEKELHFLSYRTAEQETRKVKRFCDWLTEQATSEKIAKE